MTWKLREIKAIVRTEHPSACGDLKPCALTRTVLNGRDRETAVQVYTMNARVRLPAPAGGFVAVIVNNCSEPARLWVSRSVHATRGAAVADAKERRSWGESSAHLAGMRRDAAG